MVFGSLLVSLIDGFLLLPTFCFAALPYLGQNCAFFLADHREGHIIAWRKKSRSN